MKKNVLQIFLLNHDDDELHDGREVQDLGLDAAVFVCVCVRVSVFSEQRWKETATFRTDGASVPTAGACGAFCSFAAALCTWCSWFGGGLDGCGCA